MVSQAREFTRGLSGLSELFDFLGKVFEQHEVDNRSAFWISLATEEVFTNMVRHNDSKGDRISMAIGVTERRIAVRLTDYGVPGFDPATVEPVDTTLTAEERSPGGLGVFLVQSKMDEVVYSHEDGNLSVSFSWDRESSRD